jgi:hypothetical protein
MTPAPVRVLSMAVGSVTAVIVIVVVEGSAPGGTIKEEPSSKRSAPPATRSPARLVGEEGAGTTSV